MLVLVVEAAVAYRCRRYVTLRVMTSPTCTPDAKLLSEAGRDFGGRDFGGMGRGFDGPSSDGPGWM